MSWSALAWPTVVAALLVVLPGRIIMYAAAWRGVIGWALAPVVSVVLLAGTAVVAPLVGVRWGVVPVLVATIVATGLAILAGRRWPSPGTSDGWRTTTATMAGAAYGAVVATRTVARAIGRPDVVPQSYDAVFHLSAVQFVRHGGDASSLDLGTMTAPGAGSRFYPAGWHGLTTLVAQVSGAEPELSVNAVTLVTLGIALPLSSLALARVALGRRPIGLVATGVVSTTFTGAFVTSFYGTLWPNALGLSLLPALLALLVLAAHPVVDAPLSRGMAGASAVALGCGAALVHPNITVTLLVALAATLVSVPLLPGRSAGARVCDGAIAATVLAAVLWFVGWSPVLSAPRAVDWQRLKTVPEALGEVLLTAPNRAPLHPAAGLVVVGFVIALLRGRWRWLALTHGVLGYLYVLAAGSDDDLADRITGAWYNDSSRFGGLFTVTAMVLAALAVVATVDAMAARRPGRRWPGVSAALVLGVFVVAGYGGASVNADALRWWASAPQMVAERDRALLRDLGRWVPAGETVAGNPWNGSALAQGLGGRTALFPHLDGAWDADRLLLARSLSDAASDADVCRASRRLRVGWVIDGPVRFWPDDVRTRDYPGMAVAGRRGFAPVTRGESLTLYRLTACR